MLTAAKIAGLLSGGAQLVAVPSGFNLFPAPLLPTIYKSGATYTTTTKPSDYRVAATMTNNGYHVDQAGGSNARTGLGAYDGDFSNALKSYDKAIQLGNATGGPYRIILRGGDTYSYPGLFFNVSSVAPTQSISVIGIGASRAILSSHSDPAWVLDSGTTYTGSAGVPSSTPSIKVDRVLDLATLNAYGSYTDLTAAASAAACRTTPGTYFADKTTTPNSIFVNRLDGAAVTSANTRIMVEKQAVACAGSFPSAAVMYLENIEVHGGSNVGACYFQPTNGTSIFAAENCAFRYSPGNTNGLSVYSGKLAILRNCQASANWSDGINVHDNQNGAAGYGVALLTINCTGFDNGRFTGTSCNGWTTHDGVPGIDIMGNWHHNYGSNIAPVSILATRNQLTTSWLLGSTGGVSFGNPPGGSTTLKHAFWPSSSSAWLDGCTLNDPDVAIQADQFQTPGTPSLVYLRNCSVTGPQITSGSGSAIASY